MLETTIPTTQNLQDASIREAPGLVIITTGNEPCWAVLPLLPAAPAITLGRGQSVGVELDDARMSRRHATFERRQGEWRITDHESTNGTFLDGAPVKGQVAAEDGSLVRLGNTILLLVEDVRPFGTYPVRVEGGLVVGPTLRLAHERIAQAAGQAILIRGESGAGKELAARVFHEATRGGAPGPLVAVNCATIPPGLAERILFGARKGAYSGADANVDGYFQSAHGGTLFLDEIAELDPLVQPKLLRTIESGEVMPLGATRATPVEVRICCATHADLRARVAAGSFRQDLYFRLARFEIELPPLRERREELPFLAALLASSAGGGSLKVEAAFVEQLACRHWPGNLRELGIEIHRAALAAAAAGRKVIKAVDLSPRAGQPFASASGPAPSPPPEDPIAQALEAEQGNVSKAAARLGLSRGKVRRWIEKYGAPK